VLDANFGEAPQREVPGTRLPCTRACEVRERAGILRDTGPVVRPSATPVRSGSGTSISLALWAALSLFSRTALKKTPRAPGRPPALRPARRSLATRRCPRSGRARRSGCSSCPWAASTLLSSSLLCTGYLAWPTAYRTRPPHKRGGARNKEAFHLPRTRVNKAREEIRFSPFGGCRPCPGARDCRGNL
jgi:hypothetical protein